MCTCDVACGMLVHMHSDQDGSIGLSSGTVISIDL